MPVSGKGGEFVPPRTSFLEPCALLLRILISTLRRQYVLQRMWSRVRAWARNLPAMRPPGGAGSAASDPASSSNWKATPAKCECSAFCGSSTPCLSLVAGLRRHWPSSSRFSPASAASAPGCTAPCRRIGSGRPGFIFVWILLSVRVILCVVAGWGLLERTQWGRIVAIVAAILCLIRIPLGTALGIATLIILLGYRNSALYEQL